MNIKAKWLKPSEVAGEVGRTWDHIKRQLDKSGIRGRKTDGKYRLEAVLECLAEAAKRDLRNRPKAPEESGASDYRTLKDRKLELECEKLQEQLNVIRRENIPRAEHAEALRQLAEMFVGALTEAEKVVEIVCKSDDALKGVRSGFDSLRRELVKKLQEKES